MDDRSDGGAAPRDGADGLMLVVVPALLAVTMLVTAAAFAGGEVAAPVAVAAQAEDAVKQN